MFICGFFSEKNQSALHKISVFYSTKDLILLNIFRLLCERFYLQQVQQSLQS